MQWRLQEDIGRIAQATIAAHVSSICSAVSAHLREIMLFDLMDSLLSSNPNVDRTSGAASTGSSPAVAEDSPKTEARTADESRSGDAGGAESPAGNRDSQIESLEAHHERDGVDGDETMELWVMRHAQDAPFLRLLVRTQVSERKSCCATSGRFLAYKLFVR